MFLQRICWIPFDRKEKKRTKAEMTKQNVVVSDTKSGMNMAITVAVTNSSIFTTAAQKPPTVPGTYITINQKKLLQNLEINTSGTTRINAWVDSMRASSPTHIKSTPPAHLSDDHSSWMVLPSLSLSLYVYVDLLKNAFYNKTWY